MLLKVCKAALAIFGFVLIFASQLQAADSSIGTWVRQSSGNSPTDKAELTLTIDSWSGDGRKLIYHMKFPGQPEVVATIESHMDGTEAPFLKDGKPTGETMAIKRIDSHHSLTVIRMNGKQVGTSKATLSPDFNTITVESEMFTGAAASTKVTETWIRK